MPERIPEGKPTEPNVPNWEEDANSPLSFSGQATGTVSLSKTYELVRLHFRTPGVTEQIGMQVNGTTDTYHYRLNDNTDQSLTDYIVLSPSGASSHATTVTMDGVWESDFRVSISSAESTNTPVISGRNGLVSSPLSSIKLGNFQTTSIIDDLTVHIFGIPK